MINPRSTPEPVGSSARTAESLLAQLAVVTIIGVGCLGATCWLGAQLAAIVFGNGAFAAGPSAGGAALLELPRRPTDPARAWPDDAARHLPGALPYWTCTTIVAAVLAAVATWTAWTWIKWKNRGAHPLGIQPNAGFAGYRDLRSLAVREPQRARLTLGYVGRQLVAAEPQVSLAVVGPTGCGKTAGFAIPALLEWEGPVIATSVKSDLLDATIAHRRARGRVWVYDPTRSSAQRTDRWSPLAACDDWAGAMRVAAWLCEAAQPRNDTVTDGDYWYTQARRALAPYLYAAAVDARTMRDVVRWIDTQEETEVERILQRDAGVDRELEQLLATERGLRRREQLRDDIEQAELAFLRAAIAAKHGGGGRESWETQPTVRWPLEQQQQLADRVDTALTERLTVEFTPDAMARPAAILRSDPLIAAQSLWKKEPRLRGSVFATIENVLSGYADPGVARPQK